MRSRQFLPKPVTSKPQDDLTLFKAQESDFLQPLSWKANFMASHRILPELFAGIARLTGSRLCCAFQLAFSCSPFFTCPPLSLLSFLSGQSVHVIWLAWWCQIQPNLHGFDCRGEITYFYGKALGKRLCSQPAPLCNNPVFAFNAPFTINQVLQHPGFVDSLAVRLFHSTAKYLIYVCSTHDVQIC